MPERALDGESTSTGSSPAGVGSAVAESAAASSAGARSAAAAGARSAAAAGARSAAGAGAGAGAAAARATTPSQRARREAVLAAAIALAREGGYDAVQMREVAERAGVALGTLYRYFPSKVHLLATALGDQLEARNRSVASRRRPADPGDRVLLMFDLLLHDLKDDRLLSEALVRAMMFADASVSTEVVRVREITNRMITEAVHGRGHEVDKTDAVVAEIIGKVFMSDLLGWVGDQMTIDDLRASLVSTVRVALAGRTALEV